MGKKLHDISHTVRLSHVLGILEKAGKAGLSAKEITQRIFNRGISVSEKTIRRDIDELSRDYEITEVANRPVRYLYNGAKIAAKLGLTQGEIQTLAIAIGSLRATSHDIFSESLSKFEANILSAIDSSMANLYDKTQKEYLFLSSSGKASGGEDKDLDNALFALRRRKAIKAIYSSPYEKNDSSTKTFRKFEPLRLIVNDGIPYLDVWELDKNDKRRLRITRLSKVEILDQSVDEAHMKKLEKRVEFFGAYSTQETKPMNVKITGSEVLAHYFGEKIVHSSQVIKVEDGKSQITLKIPASSEFTRLLVSLSPHIESISPKELKQSVITMLNQGLKSIH